MIDLQERINELKATRESADLAHSVELDKQMKSNERLRDDNTRLQNRLRDAQGLEAVARAQASELVKLRREGEEKNKQIKALTEDKDSHTAKVR